MTQKNKAVGNPMMSLDEVDDYELSGKLLSDPEYRAGGMESVRKCLQCAHVVSVGEPLPANCPKCGAPDSKFVLVVEGIAARTK